MERNRLVRACERASAAFRSFPSSITTGAYNELLIKALLAAIAVVASAPNRCMRVNKIERSCTRFIGETRSRSIISTDAEVFKVLANRINTSDSNQYAVWIGLERCEEAGSANVIPSSRPLSMKNGR